MKSKIYYAIRRNPASGGEYVIEEHVRSLRNNGIKAYQIIQPGPQAHLDTQTPTIIWNQWMTFTKNDYIVIPEPWKQEIDLYKKTEAKIIIHCQNPFYLFNGIDSIHEINNPRIHCIFSCSNYTSNLIKKFGYNGKIYTITPGIPNDFILTQEFIKKEVSISYMPRKRPQESKYIIGLFKSMHPDLSNIPWKKIENISRTDAAKILKSSSIFLSLSHLEGLGLPPLEAMASGNLVVGFTGHGGEDYASNENGIWIKEGEYEEVVRQIAYCIKKLPTRGIQEIIESGRKTAKNYTTENFNKSLIATWSEIIERHE